MIKLFLLILSFNAFVIFSSASESEANSIPQEDKVNALNNLNKTVKTASVKGNNESKHDKEEIKTKTEIPHSPTLVEQKNISTVQNKTTNDVEKIAPSYNGPNMMEQESKYVTTGSMILISISLLFMVFVAFKTYRRRSRDARIKKYGIRLTRGNIEMTPLPLDNDDEDETIFDLKNVPT
ncbi:uncharacterized protein LOC123688923 [Harmonia axyridis]|uniref:uncharacterized protein LOC123688923 n=1 Tax=Harmonia axyridis TaxID=115357 RepID=UPI001E275B0B|nr:uncharacterized protein LOC123688923 [Harmonia axyridis]